MGYNVWRGSVEGWRQAVAGLPKERRQGREGKAKIGRLVRGGD